MIAKNYKAHEKHEVTLRDGGRCTFTDQNGKRCAEDKWLASHHIRHVKDGGGNEAGNLVTLCWHHHDLVHQMTFDIEYPPARAHASEHA